MCTRVAQNPAPGVPASWVASGKPVLGTWQQIFHLECDVRGRQRIGGNQGDRGLAWSNDAPLKERLLELNMRAEKWERAPKRQCAFDVFLLQPGWNAHCELRASSAEVWNGRSLERIGLNLRSHFLL